MTLAYRTNAPEPCPACGNKDEPQVTYKLHRHCDGQVETHEKSGCRACCPRYIEFPTRWQYVDHEGNVLGHAESILACPIDWDEARVPEPNRPPRWFCRLMDWLVGTKTSISA